MLGSNDDRPEGRAIGRMENERPPNSPWAVLGVLAVVLGVVLVAALGGPGGLVGEEPNDLAHSEQSSETAGDHQDRFSGKVIDGIPPPGFEPAALLESNPILRPGVRVAPVTCDLPALGESAVELRRFYVAAIGCLDRAWRPALTGSGMQAKTPELVLAALRSDCGAPPGRQAATAFYCNGTVYMPLQRVVADMGSNEAMHLLLLAHEYGHHVQWETGMSRAALQRKEAGSVSESKRLEITRRTELQAECFAGLFLGSARLEGSVAEGPVRSLLLGRRAGGSSETHGTGANRRQWALAGFESSTVSACNTWTAPAGKVR